MIPEKAKQFTYKVIEEEIFKAVNRMIPGRDLSIPIAFEDGREIISVSKLDIAQFMKEKLALSYFKMAKKHKQKL